MSRQKRRRFNDEFKIEAVQLMTEKNYTLKEASDSLGVSQNSLSLWKRKYSDGGEASALEKENRQLRKELERAKMEKEILKKALGYFAEHQE